jgi:hypothetical protein
VFDLEEVGAEYLAETLQVDQAKAQELVEVGSAKAKEVAERQQREKEEAERKKQEAEAAGEEVSLDDILGGGARSASSADSGARALEGGAVPSDAGGDILSAGTGESVRSGSESAEPAETGGYANTAAEAGGGEDIVDMLEAQRAEQTVASDAEQRDPDAPEAGASGSDPEEVSEVKAEQAGSSVEALADETTVYEEVAESTAPPAGEEANKEQP